MLVLEETLYEHEAGPTLEVRRLMVRLDELPFKAKEAARTLGPLPDPLVLTAVFYQTEPSEDLTERHLVLADTEARVLAEADIKERPSLEPLYRFAMGWPEQAAPGKTGEKGEP